MKIELTTQAGELLKAVAYHRSVTPSDVILQSLAGGTLLFDKAANEETDFDEFWGAYPLKVGKEEAKRVWRKTALGRPNVQTIVKVLAKLKRSRAWTKRDENGHLHIPYPATWLHRGGWHDELEAPPEPASFSTADPQLERRIRLVAIASQHQQGLITEAEYDAAVATIKGEG